MAERALVTSEGGVRFGLSDAAFDQWWQKALLPEDADEFVHINGGNKLGARMVCAIDHLTSVANLKPPPDLIVRAYILAKKLDEDMLRDDKTRLDAQYLYADDAVQALIDRLRYRDTNKAMQRVARHTLKVVEDLYDPSGAIDVESIDDPKAKVAAMEANLSRERLAVDSGIRLMSIEQRREQAETTRRDKKAFRETLARSQAALRDSSQPPSLQEAKHFILMLRDQFGPEVLKALITEAIPIGDGSQTRAETIEANP